MPHIRIIFFAVALSAAITAASIGLLAQTAAPPAAVVGAQPAPLDQAALEKKIDELIHAHMRVNFLNNYAYGWTIGQPAAESFGGYQRVVHTGGINGFSSVILRLPEAKMTAIVLTNNDTANAGAIGRDLMAIYFGQAYAFPEPKTIE